MDIGMLWFDNDAKADLAAKLQRAVAYYQGKYGKAPNLCFVHPSMLPAGAEQAQAGGVELRTTRSMMPHHFWIGINTSN